MDVADNSLFGTKVSIFRACIHVHACTLTTVWGIYVLVLVLLCGACI